MNDFQTINQLLNLARGEYYNNRYKSSASVYESLLRYMTVVGNTVSEAERTQYSALYQQYYQEYQFVNSKYNELLTSGRLPTVKPAVVYQSPLVPSGQNTADQNEQNLGKDILNNMMLAGQAIGQKLQGLNEKYKITENTKKAVQVSIDKTKEFNEQHHITEKIKETGEKAKEYDEKHHISENIANGLRMAGLAIGNALNTAAKSVTNALSDNNTPAVTSNNTPQSSIPQATLSTQNAAPKPTTIQPSPVVCPPATQQPGAFGNEGRVYPTATVAYTNASGQQGQSAISYPVNYYRPATPPKPTSL